MLHNNSMGNGTEGTRCSRIGWRRLAVLLLVGHLLVFAGASTAGASLASHDAASGSPTAAPVGQAHARIGNDTPLNAMTWKAATDCPATGVLRNANFRVRFQVSNGATSSANFRPQLEWSTLGSPWSAVPQTAGTGPFYLADTPQFADGAPIPASSFALGSGIGTAVPGKAYDITNPPAAGAAISLGVNSYTEVEFSVRAGTAANYYQAYGFRLTNAGAALNSWANYAWVSVWETENPASPHYQYTFTTDKCAKCHRTHTASGSSLVSMTPEERMCYSCHDGTGARTDISSQFLSTYRHPVAATAGVHTVYTKEGLTRGWNALPRHVECQDCHTPHRSSSGVGASTPGFGDMSNNIVGQWGVTVSNPTTNWSPVQSDNLTRTKPVIRQYQLCLKCHSRYAYGNTPPVNPSGGFLQTDTAQEFNVNNESYHWVESDRTAATGYTPRLATPGRRASFTEGTPYTTSTPMNCTDCHASSIATAPRGVHGSSNPFLLKGTWTPTTYGLCLQCHAPNVYGPSGSENLASATGFAGGKNLHAYHVSKTDKVPGCQSCHSAIPHGWKARAMLVLTTDPAPYNNGSRLENTSWPLSGAWQENSCTTSCH
jgi:predicted CXXCH cytochrome family protein